MKCMIGDLVAIWHRVLKFCLVSAKEFLREGGTSLRMSLRLVFFQFAVGNLFSICRNANCSRQIKSNQAAIWMRMSQSPKSMFNMLLLEFVMDFINAKWLSQVSKGPTKGIANTMANEC